MKSQAEKILWAITFVRAFSVFTELQQKAGFAVPTILENMHLAAEKADKQILEDPEGALLEACREFEEEFFNEKN